MTTEPKDQFYSYDPDQGFEEHDTAEAAESFAEAAIEAYRENADDGWNEEVESVHWGRLLPLGVATQQPVTDPDSIERARERGFESCVDYYLSAQPDELGLLRTEVASLRAKLTYARRITEPERLAAENEILRARVAELESLESTLRARVQDRDETARIDAARIAELSAPPVVPEGWGVAKNALGVWVWTVSSDVYSEANRAAAYRALAWAIEHDECPPHADKDAEQHKDSP